MQNETKLIPLTQGLFTTVDVGDYEWLNQWKWYPYKSKHGYYVCFSTYRSGMSPKHTSMHRLLFNFPVGLEVDHIDGDGLNNVRSNLRLATKRQNARGFLTKRAGATSKFRGVSWREDRGRWRSVIYTGVVQMFLGYHINERDAALAYNKAAKELFGEFAQQNQVEGGA